MRIVCFTMVCNILFNMVCNTRTKICRRLKNEIVMRTCYTLVNVGFNDAKCLKTWKKIQNQQKLKLK